MPFWCALGKHDWNIWRVVIADGIPRQHRNCCLCDAYEYRECTEDQKIAYRLECEENERRAKEMLAQEEVARKERLKRYRPVLDRRGDKIGLRDRVWHNGAEHTIFDVGAKVGRHVRELHLRLVPGNTRDWGYSNVTVCNSHSYAPPLPIYSNNVLVLKR